MAFLLIYHPYVALAGIGGLLDPNGRLDPFTTRADSTAPVTGGTRCYLCPAKAALRTSYGVPVCGGCRIELASESGLAPKGAVPL